MAGAVAWMLVTVIAGQIVPSDILYPDARSCFEEAARLQVEATKAADIAFILNHEQNLSAEPLRPQMSCVATINGN